MVPLVGSGIGGERKKSDNKDEFYGFSAVAVTEAANQAELMDDFCEQFNLNDNPDDILDEKQQQ